MAGTSQTVTILFTDLIGSTELLQRAGDEQAQRIFRAHHRLLREAVDAHGGHEVKWLGDGLMVAFDSAQEAVRCAIAMQQASRRPTAGERLEVRVGLNVGEALVDDSDYFGTPVVVARRLCDRAGSGQIFASDLVLRLLDGRIGDISTKDLGALELKGITNAVPAVEIVYQHDPLALLRKLPFVGRQAEYETLLKKLADAQKGHGSVVLLAGEPGIGKTRLTEEFCEHASSGATIIRGNCYEGDAAAPFGPWLEALRSLGGQLPDDRLRDALGDGAPEIAGMLPEVRRRLADIEEAPRLDPESERGRLFDSIGAFLRNAAEQRPLVIFLDDLHWCDRPSLLLLEQIARGIADRRIVIIGTYRDVEVDRVHPLAQTLGALRRMEHHERMAVRGFTDESVVELLSAIESADAAASERDALAAVLRAEANGNPFFIREILNNLVETGKLVYRDGAWVNAAGSIKDLAIPEGVKEVVGRRLSRLSEGCNRMLQRASALTSGFTWDELRRICDEPEDELLDALDEALGSQLLAERGELAYAFTHALIRQTLYEELSGPRRVLLHRQVAEALERLYGANVEPHLGELAHHFYQAAPGGDVDKAAGYAKRAGDRAQALLAYEEAIAHYERAAEFEADDRGRCELLLALADALARAGMFTRADATFERAGDIALRLSSSELLVRSALGAEPLGLSAGVSVRLVEAALAALPPGDTAARARCLAHLAPAFGPEERGGELSSQAVEMARRLGDRETLAHALTAFYHHLVEAYPLDVRRRLDITSEVLQIATEIGDKELALASGHCDRLQDLIHLGDMAAAEADIEAHARLSLELRQGGQQCHTLWLYAMRSTIAGRFAEAEALVAQALDLGRRMEWPEAEEVYFLQMLVLRREQGRLSDLPGRPAGPDEASPGPLLLAARALLHAELEEADACRRAVELLFAGRRMKNGPQKGALLIVQETALHLWNSRRAEGPPGGAGEIVLALLAEACAWLADRTRAAVLYDLLGPYADRAITSDDAFIVLGSGSRFLGLLAATLHRWEDAEQHFEDALAMNQRMGAPPCVARTQHDYARMLLSRGAPGDRERALELLQLALNAAQEMGMTKVIDDCLALKVQAQDIDRRI
jgi:class 3 adenylate cyclase/tetratricopeptide (TPR) repeat protein